MELEGEFQVESLCILDKKVTFLWNIAIDEVKVQQEHYGPNEVTWEIEDSIMEAYPYFL
jgi:hypothetical protein